MIRFARLDNHKWDVSLYTGKENIHVGEIARLYGGGGHRGAAGFIVDILPFTI